MTNVFTGTYDEGGNRTLITEESVLEASDRNRARAAPQEVVLLVHPRDGESVVDALRRHFAATGWTVSVPTADGPRDVDVPAVFAGVAVLESQLIPAGEIRVVPWAAVVAPVHAERNVP